MVLLSIQAATHREGPPLLPTDSRRTQSQLCWVPEVSTMANLVILTALTTPILESRVPVTVNVAPTVSLETLQMLVIHF